MLRHAIHSLLLAALLGSAVSAAPTDSRSESGSAKVHWLGDKKPDSTPGTTFGVPWPRSKHWPEDTEFSVEGGSLQSWVTGYWTDGSVKWTGHAIPASEDTVDEYVVKATASKGNINSTGSAGDSQAIVVTEHSDDICVETGKITAIFPKTGSVIVESIQTSAGKQVAQNGKLVLQSQSGVSHPTDEESNPIEALRFESRVDNVTVSDQSSVRALVTVRGAHQAADGSSHDAWLPFVLRFYLYSNSESIKIIHSLIFDGDASKDFVTGIGIRFDVPLEGEELYNRHVRIAGVEGGLLSEAVQGITGLRRDPGQEVKTAQFAGEELPDISTWDERVSSRMHWIPAWNDYSLAQLSSDGFTLRKRTKAGQSWVNIGAGTRAEGLAYLGGATKGGLAVGLRDFWKRYPTGFDISNAATDTGSITLWLYSPSAEPLDLRPFHDGLGQDGYEDQLDALEITYEDWEEEFDTPFGIARTSELYLVAFDQTPSQEKLASHVTQINNPPVLVADPTYLRATEAIGTYWAPADAKTEASKTLEANLDFLASFY
ncbi:Tat pathway signal sequence domain protein, partial [Candidatus Bathyarchaeota archaeon]|nr:Tat pathway signal sequence domain protein [Candidatus Bathyarchaeota archaeon]